MIDKKSSTGLLAIEQLENSNFSLYFLGSILFLPYFYQFYWLSFYFTVILQQKTGTGHPLTIFHRPSQHALKI